MTPALEDICVCPHCLGDLAADGGGLMCAACERSFETPGGIPILLGGEDAKRVGYRRAYEDLAREDLHKPLVADKDVYLGPFRKFIGNVRGKRVLDVGSSQGVYLERLDADVKVAVDLARPYLEAIEPETGIVRVCADAERLPFKPGYFDVIIVADVLEHVLEPERVMAAVHRIARPDTRIIVQSPWEEDLSQYVGLPYKYVHLRSFNGTSLMQLFREFDLRRRRFNHPRIDEPLFMRIGRRMPTFVLSLLTRIYLASQPLQAREQARRNRRQAELPKRQWWLLWFYRPVLVMLEYRKRRRRRDA